MVIGPGDLYHKFSEQRLIHARQFEQFDVGGVAEYHLSQRTQSSGDNAAQQSADDAKKQGHPGLCGQYLLVGDGNKQDYHGIGESNRQPSPQGCTPIPADNHSLYSHQGADQIIKQEVNLTVQDQCG